MEIKNKQLELDENEQIIDILKSGASDNYKKVKSEKDRESKEKIKKMDVLAKVGIEQSKIDAEDDRTKERILKDIIEQNMKDGKELDMKGLEALVKLATEKSKEE